MEYERPDDAYVLNFVAKYLSRTGDAGPACEPWRFPLIESSPPPADHPDAPAGNLVTFVWRAADESDHREVRVSGTFCEAWDSLPLQPVSFDGRETLYRAVSARVPIGQVYVYKFIVGGLPMLDPINPQLQRLDNGAVWSRFFTDYCSAPISFETWEFALLARLTNVMLPFTEGAALQFMNLFYFKADRAARDTTFSQAFRLKQPIGAVNFIDNVLAREESHNLIHYQICLDQIDSVLRSRFPGYEPTQLNDDAFTDLYKQMGANAVDGWNTAKYRDPVYFLKILRRHTYLGAFSHPKHGGNAGGAGWAFLEDRFRDAGNQSCFDWRPAIEPPLGKADGYLG